MGHYKNNRYKQEGKEQMRFTLRVPVRSIQYQERYIMRSMFVFFLLVFSMTALSGNLANYTFSQSITTYTSISGGTTLGNSETDDQKFVDPAVPLGGSTVTGPGFPIGFNFVFNDVTFDRIGINANGWISLGQSALSPSVIMASTSDYAPLANTATISPVQLSNRIAIIAGNLRASSSAGGRIYYKVSGIAPNRSCSVEW